MSVLTPKLMHMLAEMGQRVSKMPNRVIFLGRVGGALIDNVKYAFLDCVRHFPQLDCYFLTHDPRQHYALQQQGLPALLFPESDAIRICASASVAVCDDFWWRARSPVHLLLSEARVMQLWHGIPLKSIGFPEAESAVNMTPEKAASLKENYSGYDAVLSTSPYFTEHAFARAFRADDFPELGYPRNDIMLRAPDKFDMINVDTKLYGLMRNHRKNGGRVAFYMPTFRDNGGDPFSVKALSPARLQQFGEEHNVLFISKFHPYLESRIKSNLPNLHICPSSTDAYPLLHMADALVTDYSSVYFDYLLLDRPIVYFQYDHQEYTSINRELMLDMDTVTPGPRVADEEALYKTLAAVLSGDDQHKEERRALLDKSFTHHDSKAGVRVNEYILQQFMHMDIQHATTSANARRATA